MSKHLISSLRFLRIYPVIRDDTELTMRYYRYFSLDISALLMFPRPGLLCHSSGMIPEVVVAAVQPIVVVFDVSAEAATLLPKIAELWCGVV